MTSKKPAPSLTREDGLLVHEGVPVGDLLHAVEAARAQRDEQVIFCGVGRGRAKAYTPRSR